MPSSGARKQVKYRPFEALHPKDQQIKQTKKLCIEQNWKCKIEECLPPAIRPRVEVKKGAKIRVDIEDTQDEKWWNWSVELLKAVEELSSMTEGELEYAQELFELEVEHRQSNPKSSQRKIIELLLGDAQKVVDEQRKRLAVKYTAEGMEMTGEPMNAPYGQISFPQTVNTTGDLVKAPSNALVPSRQSGQSRLHTPDSDYLDSTEQQLLLSGEPDTTSEQTPRTPFGKRPANTDSDAVTKLRRKVKLSELKARAARLRAKAAHVESQALDIEAEAKNMQDELQDIKEQS